jgi:hypothetical protein
MNKYVLTEFLELENDSSLLTEQERMMNEKGDHLILAGRLQKADAKNGNGRIYPKKVLEREVQNYKKLVHEARALGELDHPDSSVIELKNASHIVTHIEMKGDEVIGKLKVLDTPAGKIAKDLIKGGVKLGVSSRGLGSTKEQGGNTIVQDDFQLICFDLVSEPSTTGAFLFKEHKEPNIFTKSDKIYRALNDILIEGE